MPKLALVERDIRLKKEEKPQQDTKELMPAYGAFRA